MYLPPGHHRALRREARERGISLTKRHGIDEALALDTHFRVFRTGPGRRRAFRVTP